MNDDYITRAGRELRRFLAEIGLPCEVEGGGPQDAGWWFRCMPEGKGGMYATWTVNLDMLDKIAKHFNTRRINIEHKEGWGGTEVTPGDPDQCVLRVWVSEGWDR